MFLFLKEFFSYFRGFSLDIFQSLEILFRVLGFRILLSVLKGLSESFLNGCLLLLLSLRRVSSQKLFKRRLCFLFFWVLPASGDELRRLRV